MGSRAQGPLAVTQRWGKRVGLAILLLTIAGLGFEQWSRWSAEDRYPPVGTMVQIDGIDSHLSCAGEGSPTVLLEAGHDPSGSQIWAAVQPDIAAFTRVCSYDRAGVLYSAPRTGPRDGSTIAKELRALLDESSETGPYVMVGHSLGGSFVRIFAAGPGEGTVEGFVFVDTSHPEQWKRWPAEMPPPRPPSPLLQRALARLGLLRLRPPPRPEALPQAAYERIIAFMPQSTAALIDEREARDATFEQAQAAGPLGDRPLVVLTAGGQPPELREFWNGLQAELADLSTNSDHRIIEGAGHYIQLDKPQAVVTAVRDVVSAARQGSPVAGDEG